MTLHDLTLLEASARLRAGDVTSLQLTEACLARIGQVDPELRAFLTLTPPKQVRKQEEAAEDHGGGHGHAAAHDDHAALPANTH